MNKLSLINAKICYFNSIENPNRRQINCLKHFCKKYDEIEKQK